MTKLVLAGAVLALVPVTAFSQPTTQDLAFVQSSTHVDLVSVQEGQTALTSASNPAVRSFAQAMVQYHTDANHTLASIVQPPAPPPPTTLSPCLVWQARLLQQTTGTPFDPSYLQATIYDHQRLVTVLQGEIQNGADANLKAHAQMTLPVIQGHLQEAQQLLNGAPPLPPPVTVHPTFRSGEYSLSAADQQSLADIAHRLAGMQQVTVTATGYTDNVPIGPELKRAGIPTNEVLSQKRAESVKQYLASQGVPADEIQTQGMGPANPVASNATEAGRAQNRRVEVAVAGAAAPVAMGGPATTVPECRE